jgi:hypothetical protein
VEVLAESVSDVRVDGLQVRLVRMMLSK